MISLKIAESDCMHQKISNKVWVLDPVFVSPTNDLKEYPQDIQLIEEVVCLLTEATEQKNWSQLFENLTASQLGWVQEKAKHAENWLLLRPGPNGSELPKDESGVSRDLASAYVLCLRTFVVPNLRRDEGKSLGKKEQIERLRKLTRVNEVDF